MTETPTANQTSPARSSLVTETVNGSYMFEIQGYSVAKGVGVGKYIPSDVFTVGGYEWAIYFYPDGKIAEDNSNYVSVFVALASAARGAQTLFELTLMDQSGKGKHMVRSHFARTLPCTLKCGGLWGFKRFVSREILENSDYLRNDCLKIYCTVGVVIDRSLLSSIEVPDSDIGSHIGMLLENMEGCDVTFNVSGEKLHAHKFILSARSTKFRAELLEGAGTEGEEVMVPDMEPEVFKALLQFIYRDALDENELKASSSRYAPSVADTLTAKLLAAADRYDLKRLKKICESHLCKDVSINSVTQVIALADRCHAAELKDVCLKFAAQNLAGYVRISNDQVMPPLNQHTAGMPITSQQAMTSGMSTMTSTTSQQSVTTLKLNKQVPDGMLLPIILPDLEKDKAMQLCTLYSKLQKKEISKDDFVRKMRSIVGDQMLKMAASKLQTQAAGNSQSATNQFQSQPQASEQQMQVPPAQLLTDLSNSISDNNAAKSPEVETPADSHGTQVGQMPTSSSGALSHEN